MSDGSDYVPQVPKVNDAVPDTLVNQQATKDAFGTKEVMSREDTALASLIPTIDTMSKADLGRASEQLADSGLDLGKMATKLDSTKGLDPESAERLGKMVNRAQTLSVGIHPCAYHY